MARQVQQLSHLAEASEPQNYELASVDAESLISEVMNYLERIANQRGVRMQAVVDPGLTLLRADRAALFTLLKNLLENAIQHSHAGGAVQPRDSHRCHRELILRGQRGMCVSTAFLKKASAASLLRSVHSRKSTVLPYLSTAR